MTPRDRGPLTERIFQALRRDIIAGYFKPGEALAEMRLAKRYAASRTPVRQAAARALHEGLLRFVPSKGYFVTLATVDQVNELYQYRIIIEGACAELAAKKEHSAEVVERLGQHAGVGYTGRGRKGFLRYIEADRAFHLSLARMTRNRFLLTAVESLRTWIDRFLYAAADRGEFPLILANHDEIFQAIKAHDPTKAKRLMLEHLLESRSKVLEMM